MKLAKIILLILLVVLCLLLLGAVIDARSKHRHSCNSAPHWSCDGPRAATAGDGHSTVTVYQRRMWVWLDGRKLWK